MKTSRSTEDKECIPDGWCELAIATVHKGDNVHWKITEISVLSGASKKFLCAPISWYSWSVCAQEANRFPTWCGRIRQQIPEHTPTGLPSVFLYLKAVFDCEILRRCFSPGDLPEKSLNEFKLIFPIHVRELMKPNLELISDGSLRSSSRWNDFASSSTLIWRQCRL